MAPMAIHPPGKARQPADQPTWLLPIEISWASTAGSLAL
jgi:hypothetical protein